MKNDENNQKQFDLAVKCFFGMWGVKKDEKKACKIFKELANQGHAEAQYYFGTFFSKKNTMNDEGIKWIKISANNGCKEAQYFLSEIYSLEYNVDKDYKESFKWMKKVAEQTEDYNYEFVAKAQYHVGRMYAIGQGVKQDYKEAFNWYLKSAICDHAKAQYHVGRMYGIGQGVKQDYIKSIEWYGRSAIMMNEKAIIFLKKLAKQGNVEAIDALAEI